MTKLIVAFRNFPKAPTNKAPTIRTERRRQDACGRAQGKVAGAKWQGGTVLWLKDLLAMELVDELERQTYWLKLQAVDPA